MSNANTEEAITAILLFGEVVILSVILYVVVVAAPGW